MVIMLSCLALIMGVLYQYFSKQQTDAVIAETRYVATAVEKEGLSYFNNLPPTTNRITWVGADGQVLYDSTVDTATMENHANREEIHEAFTFGHGESKRYSDTLSRHTYYYALQLKDDSVLRMSATYYSPLMLLLSISRPLAVVILISVLLSLFLAYRLAKSVVKPINELDLAHPDVNTVGEELAPLLQKLEKQNQTIRNQMADLYRQQKEFKTISENMSEGWLVVDRNGTVLSYNTAATRLLDVQPENDNQNVLTFNQSRRFRKAVEESLAGNHSMQLMNLSDRTYQIIGNPVTEKGKPVGAVLAILDVTEREERDKLRKEFSANVSHELKTPLTSISGFAEIMMNGMVDAKDVPRFAGKIHQEAGRLIALVRDIIQISRLDEKDMSDQMQHVELYSLAEQILSRFTTQAEKNNITLGLQGSICHVEGVPQILEEMISNLCDNAIKYNRTGGSVTIAVTPKDNTVMLSVSDTGMGIPYEDQTRVFERFYRGDKSHSSQIPGTGLGLSIVKHAAMFHSANVSLESVPLEGTTITITFPSPDK
jgi:two-component system phosphate regulon sensor histidine kinase PhoR